MGPFHVNHFYKRFEFWWNLLMLMGLRMCKLLCKVLDFLPASLVAKGRNFCDLLLFTYLSFGFFWINSGINKIKLVPFPTEKTTFISRNAAWLIMWSKIGLSINYLHSKRPEHEFFELFKHKTFEALWTFFYLRDMIYPLLTIYVNLKLTNDGRSIYFRL